MSTSRILELAKAVHANTEKLDAYLNENNLPFPSFEEHGAVDFGIKSQEVEGARVAAMEAAIELHDLLLGPAMLTRPVLNGSALQAIYKWDIPSKVPLDGKVSYKELAEACNLHEIDIRRLIRFAMIYHRVFQEKEPGFVSHTAASRKLVEDPLAMMGLGLMFEEVSRAYNHTVEALDKHKDSKPNETGWSLGHNTDMAIYQYHRTQPQLAKRFGGAMTLFSKGTGQSLEYLADGYDWSAIGGGHGTLVDVGGGNGNTAFKIAKSAPGLRCVVQELPANVENFKDTVPDELADRVQFMAHDFFEPQPVQADAYLFRQIFHNWADQACVRILKATVPALRPGVKIIANDRVVPPPGTMPLLQEREIRDIDLIMLSLMNATEREANDWKKIFAEADSRFTDIKIWTPQGSDFSIIEATWSG